MPRRRRRHHNYDGSNTGPCCCCNYWRREEEEVGKELIIKRVESRPHGAAVKRVACDCCFDRHCIQRLYLAAGIGFGILLLATLGFASNGYSASLYLEGFESTSCRVVRIENLTSSCQYDRGRGQTGSRKYRCLRIFVRYDLKDGKDGDARDDDDDDSDEKGSRESNEQAHRNSTSLFFHRYSDMQSKKFSLHCTKQPDECRQFGDIERDILDYERHFKEDLKQSSFDCYYNPDKPGETIAYRGISVQKARSYLILLCLVVILLGLLLLLMCTTCGCQYIWASRAPADVVDEVEKREAEARGLTGGSTQPQVVYVGAGVQIPPGTVAVPPPAQPYVQPMPPAQPPMTHPQYGPYQPGAGYPPPQGPPPPQAHYPQQPGQYPPPAGPYPPPQPAYPPPPGAYPPPPGQFEAPPRYEAEGGPPPPAVDPVKAAAPPTEPSAPSAASGGYQPPTYQGLGAGGAGGAEQAGELPPKQPVS